MDDLVLLGVLAGVLGLLLWFAVTHITGIRKDIGLAIAGFSPDPFHITEEIEQKVYDLLQMAIEDSIGNMEQPSAKDHLVGGVMQLVLQRFGGLDNLNLIKDGLTSMGHGQEEIETEETLP